MSSIPQLKKDINALQEKLAAAELKNKELINNQSVDIKVFKDPDQTKMIRELQEKIRVMNANIL